ncbi:MAG TPA: hypothetical protein VME21_17930 [Steroidobacteraceae bacterium]|nr:hypothetical protein [Steroidobacteraceae bacterium]
MQRISDSGTRAATIYRVAPAGVSTWNVYADSAREPIAAFDDRSAAVRYALRLARGRTQRPAASAPPALPSGSARRTGAHTPLA